MPCDYQPSENKHLRAFIIFSNHSVNILFIICKEKAPSRALINLSNDFSVASAGLGKL